MKKHLIFMKKILVTISLVFQIGFASHAQMNSIVAETEFGKVSGLLTNDGKIKVFKGIPFAAPPVGELRWKKPMPPVPWKDVRVCTTFSASPMQPKPTPFFVWTEEYLIPTAPISEDCLYLNIWTSSKEKQKKKSGRTL